MAEIIPFEHDEVILGMEICDFSPSEDSGGFFMFVSAIIPYLFYPLISASIVVILAACLLAFADKKNKNIRVYRIVSGTLLILSLLVIIVFLSIYYDRKIAPSGDYVGVSSVWLWTSAVALILIISFICILCGHKANNNSETLSIAYAAVMISLAFGLSYIKIFSLPAGGSITLVSVLPIVLYSQMFGIRKGVIVGFIYGILQAIQDPWLIHPAQFLLDYPIAFSAIGLSGIFTEGFIKDKKSIVKFLLGTILGGALRYFAHILSGIFAFESYVGAGYGVVEWSFMYNTFCLVDLFIVMIILCLLLLNKSFRYIVNNISMKSMPQPMQSSETNRQIDNEN